MPVLDPEGLIRERVDALKQAHRDAGLARAQLDVSGGIDSATMLALLVRALGPDSITAVYSSIHSSTASAQRAREVASHFGVRLVELDLSASFDALLAQLRAGLEAAGYPLAEIDARMASDGTVLGSIRSCLRAPVGRGLNRMTGGGLRHGTGNECEDRWLRFYQKGGDGEVDSNPLAMLSKGEVYQLALALGVPVSIIEATPTPDLQAMGERHNDEDELRAASGGVPWTYSRIDARTGAYRRVGSIERLSRTLDLTPGVADLLFGEADPFADPDQAAQLMRLSAQTFPGHDEAQRREFLRSARRWEALTRHKLNPNCPSYGTRTALRAAGLITDALPELGEIHAREES